MNIQNKILTRLEELLRLADNVLATQAETRHGGEIVDSELFNQFKLSTLSLIKNVFGENHHYYRYFQNSPQTPSPYNTKNCRGILNSIKEEVEGGWVFSLEQLISANIFSDFIEMADYLLNENYKDASAVIIGSTLEEHLRKLAKQNGVKYEEDKHGKKVFYKADRVNAELHKSGVYNQLDMKSITSWLDLRNKAAHGHYSEYTKEQVKLMLEGVRNFISRT